MLTLCDVEGVYRPYSPRQMELHMKHMITRRRWLVAVALWLAAVSLCLAQGLRPEVNDDSVRVKQMRDSVRMLRRQGQLEEAYELGHRLLNEEIRLLYHKVYEEEELIEKRRRESKARAEEAALQRETQRIRTENAQHLMDEESAKMEQLHLEEEILKQQQRQNALQAKQNEAEKLHLEGELRKEADKARYAHQRSLLRNVVMGVLLTFLVVIAVLLWRHNRKVKTAVSMLNDATHRAREADNMKTFFIQNLSHEIRTPLSAIVGCNNMLLDNSVEMAPEERSELTRMVNASANQLITLVSDIINLSELKHGELTFKREPAHVNEMMRYALKAVEPNKAKDVRMYWTSDVDDPFTLDTDEVRVQQVLINYLTNACKFTSEGEIHLHCSLTEEPGQLCFSVSDTGIGIPADKAESIFERYERLDSMKEGNGLGLNICRMVAQTLGGEVKLDTKYRRGARFLFIHPLQRLATMVVLLLGFALGSRAQADLYGVTQQEYDWMMQLRQLTDTARCFQLADSLILASQRSGSHKAELLYYSTAALKCTESLEQRARYAKPMIKLGEKYGYSQYTYHAWNTLITMALNHHRYYEAQRYMEQMIEQAERTQDKYGIRQVINLTGHFHMQRNEYQKALEYYRRYYEYTVQHVPEQDPCTPLIQVIQCMLRMEYDSTELVRTIDLAERSALTETSRTQARVLRLDFLLRRDAERFLQVYREVEPSMNEYGFRSDNILANRSAYLFLTGHEEEARALLAQTSPSTRFSTRIHVALAKGDYRRAIRYQDSIKQYRLQEMRMGQVYSDILHEIEDYENANRQNDTHLSLLALQEQDAQLKASLLADSLRTRLMRQHHDSLRLANQQRDLKLQQLGVANEKRNLERERKESQERLYLNRYIFLSVALQLVCATLVVIYMLVRRRRLQRTLRRVNVAFEEVRRSDEEKTRFIQHISHEIRTPLNAIVGFTTLLDADPHALGDEERNLARASIEENTRVLSGIVDNILMLSRLQSGKTKLSPALHSVDELCRQAINKCHVQPGVEMRFQSHLAEGYVHLVDPHFLLIMLVQLLGNACKFTPKGYVSLDVSLHDGRLHFIVEDTGPGISAKHASLIFREFYKCNEYAPGTGLGLSLARTIARRMGGDILLDIGYTQGARFVAEVAQAKAEL